MNDNICTLFEGDYHYGVGALVNSLYIHGFRGVCWAGYKGKLPLWAKPIKQCQDYHEFQLKEGCVIRFIQLNTDYHLVNYKPIFMLNLWDKYCPKSEFLFYFDADIVNKCRWSFYKEWASYGVALCEDKYNHLPINSPYRLAWLSFADEQGYHHQRSLNEYYNAGFIGVSQEAKSLLHVWQKVQEDCDRLGHFSLGKFYLSFSGKQANLTQEKTYPYIENDQDALNLTLMLVDNNLSTFGPEAMDFVKPGGIMSHAAGGNIVKPWRKLFIREALRGNPPSGVDKLFWLHVQEPIQMYRNLEFSRYRFALRVSSAIGRFIKRTPKAL